MIRIHADTKSFFESELHSQAINGDHKTQIEELLNRCKHILLSLDANGSEQTHIDGVFGDSDNSSYLDMSMRKPDAAIEVTEDGVSNVSGRNEYVDVIDKSEKVNFPDDNRKVGDNEGNGADGDGDDNIYDNYIVENKVSDKSGVCGKELASAHDTNGGSGPSPMANGKRDCPFGGLPAAHLTIKKARKIGSLILNHRRRPFLHILNSYLSKKFYVGLLCDTMENDAPEWWMLMYSGTNQMKPTLCIDLRRFELVRVIAKKRKRERGAANADVKFELHEKTPPNASKKFVPIVYQFATQTTDECDQWFSTLMLLNSESTHSISSGTNRKLPMLPPYECEDSPDPPSGRHHQSDGLLYTNQDVHNYSEGVYEEPEEYYRQIDKPIATSSPILSLAAAQPTNTPDPLWTYDVPKSPARPVQISEQSSIAIEMVKRHTDTDDAAELCTAGNADDYDKVIVDSTSSAANRDASGRTKINEIRIKLTSHFKEHSQKYLSDTSSSSVTSYGSRKTNSAVSADRPTDNPKVQQISSVRKFVSNLARMKRSSAATPKSPKSPKSIKRERKPIIPKMPSEEPLQRTNKRNKVHMIINQLEANGQLTLLSGGAGVGPSGYNGSNRNSVNIPNK